MLFDHHLRVSSGSILLAASVVLTLAQFFRAQDHGKKAAPDPGSRPATARLGLPFKKSWVFLTDSAAPFPATTDSGRVFLPLAGGRVVCLDIQTGSLVWSSEPGGEISSPIALGKGVIFVVTRVAGAGQATGSIRAMDVETGLTQWARDYDRPFTGPLLADERLYCGSADGSLYALSAADGAVIWKAATQDIIRASVLSLGDKVYFGSNDGALRGVEAPSGKEVFKFQTRGSVTSQPAVKDGMVYFGSGDGYVYAVVLDSARLKWRARTGAAVVASPIIASDKLICGSLDNFVYALDLSSGDRLWKRRLDGRITDAPVVEGDLTMVNVFRGDRVWVFLNADGRQVNSYRLESGYEIVAGPVHTEDTLLIPTDRGLVVARAQQPGESRRPRVRERPQ